jgi:glycerol kinase
MKKYILALDQGTTSSRAIVFDENAEVCAAAQKEFPQVYPQPGWVEHDPFEILKTQIQSAKEAIRKSGAKKGEIVSVGIANQRETTVIWDRKSGNPVYNAIVWQCRRTADICKKLAASGFEKEIRKKTGLVIDPYFSATKIQWLLEHLKGLAARAEKGEVCFGTIDSWLLFQLTGEHRTDPSNASRTMLFDIRKGEWDDSILNALKIPRNMLPEVLPSVGEFGVVKKKFFGYPIPVTGIAGDQQAALFGQCCFNRGEVKNTYGTGCFTLINTGKTPVVSKHNLLTTVAWDKGKGLEYALEGSVFVAGAAIQWLRDELAIIESAQETETLANSVTDTGGVYFVPAFTGLGAPYWNPAARGTLVGLTRGTKPAHIARAALESLAFQSVGLFSAMGKDMGKRMTSLKADGGAAKNDFLLQFQADLIGTPVTRPAIPETTALGAAFLAGLGAGIWKDEGELAKLWQADKTFYPKMDAKTRNAKLSVWEKAVKATLAFAE